jgi:1,4-alpha-glucan branching enzyme
VIATSRQGPDTVRVTFRLRCGVGRHDVCVVGEFNDWSRTANPMTFDGYAYVAKIIIPTGCVYRFRYLIDDERWQIDWAADRFAPNEARGFDAILDLTRPRTSTLASTGSGLATDGSALASGRGSTDVTTSV